MNRSFLHDPKIIDASQSNTEAEPKHPYGRIEFVSQHTTVHLMFKTFHDCVEFADDLYLRVQQERARIRKENDEKISVDLST